MEDLEEFLIELRQEDENKSIFGNYFKDLKGTFTELIKSGSKNDTKSDNKTHYYGDDVEEFEEFLNELREIRSGGDKGPNHLLL